MLTRTRTSRDERVAFVIEQQNSGMSAMAFCRQRGIGYQKFLRWKRMSAGAPCRSAPAFIELAVEPGAAPPGPATALAAELHLGSGMVLKVFTRQPLSR